MPREAKWYPVETSPAHEHKWVPFTRVAQRWPARSYVLFTCACGELLRTYDDREEEHRRPGGI